MKKIVVILFAVVSSAFAQEVSKFKKENFVQGIDTLKYRILYPENFDVSKHYPVVFFLHGSGERGNDNEKQLLHGASLFLNDEIRHKFPAIVIFPQCAEDSYWANVEVDTINTKHFFTFVEGGNPTKAMNLLLKLTHQIISKPYVDKSRIYIGGLSMGGMGTYEMLRRQPNIFAAAFSICGADNILNAKKYKNIPLWIFHGAEDDVVSPQYAYDIYHELKKLHHQPKFSLYLEANHNSWDKAFAEPLLIPWLFANHK